MKKEVLSQIDAVNFRRALLRWFDAHARDLPWRRSKAPYHVWLSEILLQQTRVDQGTPYYERFIAAFPTVQDLAAAQEDAVLKLWEGLGYYARARNLLRAAREIVQKGGAFPKTAEEWQTLPGIGRYTAGAIASIAFNERTPLVDGNVARVLCRVYNIRSLLTANETQAQLWSLAEHLVPARRPGDFNQALMELGALVCTPKNPGCTACPLSVECLALKRNETERYPLKTPKKLPTLRYLNYLVASYEDGDELNFLVKKRTGNDIWKNLFDFPCIETREAATVDQVLEMAELQGLLPVQAYTVKKVSGDYIHQLTHRRLVARFIRLHLRAVPGTFSNSIAVRKDQLATLPVPRLIDRYLANLE